MVIKRQGAKRPGPEISGAKRPAPERPGAKRPGPQLTENVTGTLAFGCKSVWSNLTLLKHYCNVSRFL